MLTAFHKTNNLVFSSRIPTRAASAEQLSNPVKAGDPFISDHRKWAHISDQARVYMTSRHHYHQTHETVFVEARSGPGDWPWIGDRVRWAMIGFGRVLVWDGVGGISRWLILDGLYTSRLHCEIKLPVCVHRFQKHRRSPVVH